MVQKTFYVRSVEELKDRADDIKKMPGFESYSQIVVLLYVNGYLMSEAGVFVDAIRSELSDAVVCGISVMTSNSNWDEYGVSASFLMFESSKAALYTYKSCDYSEQDVIDDFSKVLKETKDAKIVFTYPVDPQHDVSRVLSCISSIDPEIVFFGAMAGSSHFLIQNGSEYNHDIIKNGKDLETDSEEDRMIKDKVPDENAFFTYSIGHELIGNGYVFVVVSGELLHTMVKYVLGWNSLGKPMKVTKYLPSDRFGNVCIGEIDGVSATNIYKKYLDVDVNEYLLDNVCEFPISFERNGVMIARVPLYADANEALYFAGDIDKDDVIRLSYAVPFDLINLTVNTARQIQKYEPEGLILSVCFNRYHFLKEREQVEIEAYEKVSPDFLYGFAGSEILRVRGKGGILNSALVALAISEGEKKGNRSIIVDNKGENQGKIKPLLERLMFFVESASKELEEAYKAAEQASSSKSSFLSNMSHEIRTPINAILGMNEMILRESRDDHILGYAADVKIAGLNLLRIVNNVLDFSKIEAGKMEIVPVEYELASVLNDLVNMIRERAKDKGLDFRLIVDPMIPHLLYGDEIRLKQIITNILTNAVKYTEKGGVVLSVRWKACNLEDIKAMDKDVISNLKGNSRCHGKDIITLEISVEDTGIGIKPEDMERLFDSFERVDEKRNRTIEGTGLGMSITQSLLGLMGSELHVESNYGYGSIFSFELTQKIVDETPIGNFEDALKRSITAVERYHESFVAPNASILVVDDTEMNLTVFKNLLKQTKLQIDTARSGKECLDKLSYKKYDLVFLDHRMPEMDGIECLEHIKEDTEGININTPIIALTANAVSGSREMYLDVGFDNYLTKPIQTGMLEKCIIDYLPDNLVTRVDISEKKDEEVPKWIKQSPFLNYKIGINRCGDLESYISALQSFEDSVFDTKDYIDSSISSGNITDYTTKVHALKSSSRIIGATELGTLAETLENAGNDNDIETINLLTDELLIYLDALGNFLKKYLEPLEEEASCDTDKEEITKDKLDEAYMAIKELAQMYDYDSIALILEELGGYIIKGQDKEKINNIQKALKLADWDKITQIMEG
ncbi:response regulator [Butyrivibrio fibrisolvens]|uniref:response regulator n=1 Tax=Butyrivibrio fibrisolvens TaxID=831 RepID=UPI00040D75B9|nr:response regulator [Butyrivibrio fibrisolvens]